MPTAKPRPPGRQPWTKAACLGAGKFREEFARSHAARLRVRTRGDVIAFRCPHGQCRGNADHYHVAPPPAACAACGGAGQNSKGTNECAGCGGTGVKRA